MSGAGSATRYRRVNYWDIDDSDEGWGSEDVGDELWAPEGGPDRDDLTAPESDADARDALSTELVLQARFDRLADTLAADSVGVSATRRLVAHPAYNGIVLLGKDAIPYLIDRVESGEHRPTWLKLLGSVTKLPPSAGQSTIDASAEAWIRWARTEAPRS
jgi:hypothetical protein